MTGFTSPTKGSQHVSNLRVLDGGLTTERQLQDETADALARDRLAEEIAEAARLCDRLEDAGLRVAFELGGPKRVQVAIRDTEGATVQELHPPDSTDLERLLQLSGLAS
jgi:hypothetical protein